MKHLLIPLILLASCTSGADYLREQREAVGIPADYRVEWCTHDHAAFCDWNRHIICIHRDWLWQPSMFVKGVLVHEYVHSLGYHEHTPRFAEMCDHEADRVGIPRWAIPRHGEMSRLDAQDVYTGAWHRQGVGIHLGD